MRLSHEPCVGVKMNWKRPTGCLASQALVSVRAMIVEDQLDRCVSWIGGIEKLEKCDEFAAAMTVPDEGVNLTGEQINTGQQTDSTLEKLNPRASRLYDQRHGIDVLARRLGMFGHQYFHGR
jgi:hypothetical protein